MAQDGVSRPATVAATAVTVVLAALIGLIAIAANQSTRVTVPIHWYSVDATGTMLTVNVGLTRLDQVASATAQEAADSVRIEVTVERRPGTAPSDILFTDVNIMLGAPLGERIVRDQTGSPVPRK